MGAIFNISVRGPAWRGRVRVEARPHSNARETRGGSRVTRVLPHSGSTLVRCAPRPTAASPRGTPPPPSLARRAKRWKKHTERREMARRGERAAARASFARARRAVVMVATCVHDAPARPLTRLAFLSVPPTQAFSRASKRRRTRHGKLFPAVRATADHDKKKPDFAPSSRRISRQTAASSAAVAVAGARASARASRRRPGPAAVAPPSLKAFAGRHGPARLSASRRRGGGGWIPIRRRRGRRRG